jgi:ABC-type transport system involved in cytochrome c biogenesis permease subunit
MNARALIYSTVVLYVLSSIHYLVYLLVKKEKVATVGLYSARFGFLTNLLAFILLISEKGTRCLFTPESAFLLFALTTVGVFLYFSTKYRISLSGAFLMPWASVFSTVSAFGSGIPKENLQPGLIGLIHIISGFLGYSSFIVSAIFSLIYLISEKHLKKKKISVFFQKLTSLPTLESIVYHSLTLGFVLITISMFAGALWSQRVFGSYWSWHPKQVATLITWFVYASIIHLYVYAQWKGKKICYLSIFGFVIIMLNFVGINFLTLKDVHSFKG